MCGISNVRDVAAGEVRRQVRPSSCYESNGSIQATHGQRSIAGTINTMESLLRSCLCRFFFLILLIQAIFLLGFFYRTSDQARIQRVKTEKYTSAAVAIFNNVPVHDFGLMGKKAAALANIAERYVHTSTDASSLTELMAKQFPWWNSTTLHYFLWKYKAWREKSLLDLKLFGSKTGIVICTGDGIAREAAHLIVYLRNVHNSKLPIDIAYIGDADLSPRSRSFLSQLGENIYFIDLTTVFDNNLLHLASYAPKPFALSPAATRKQSSWTPTPSSSPAQTRYSKTTPASAKPARCSSTTDPSIQAAALLATLGSPLSAKQLGNNRRHT